MRSTCPDEDVWNEEFMCVPSADATSLLSYDLLAGGETSNLELLDVTTPNLSRNGGPLYAGFDVGRKRDLSVLWVLEKVGDVFWTRILRTFDRVNFSAQEGVINQLMQKATVKRLCIDSTGIGLQLSERLQQRHGKYRVEAVNFSAPVKSELAMPLRTALRGQADSHPDGRRGPRGPARRPQDRDRGEQRPPGRRPQRHGWPRRPLLGAGPGVPRGGACRPTKVHRNGCGGRRCWD
jgi:phage FluMu gp28-like protein